MELHAARTLGPAKTQQKTISVMAPSFGAGRALLLENALNTGRTIAVVSTATQRVGEGLVGRLSYIFGGVRELATSLAETKLKEVVMPLLGAGHAGLSSSLALIGLLVAVAEVVRYGPGSSKLRRVTIVVFQKDEHATPAVSRAEIHHALALISQKG